jgi:hypothetical protein
LSLGTVAGRADPQNVVGLVAATCLKRNYVIKMLAEGEVAVTVGAEVSLDDQQSGQVRDRDGAATTDLAGTTAAVVLHHLLTMGKLPLPPLRAALFRMSEPPAPTLLAALVGVRLPVPPSLLAALFRVGPPPTLPVQPPADRAPLTLGAVLMTALADLSPRHGAP